MSHEDAIPATETAEQVDPGLPADRGAREALVEHDILTIVAGVLGCDITPSRDHATGEWSAWCETCGAEADEDGCTFAQRLARAVLPVVAAQVEAAVSVVRAEREAEVAQLREALRIGIELDNHHNAAVCPYCKPRPGSAEADLRALREGLEALADEVRFPTVGSPYGDGWNAACDEVGSRLRALLAPSPAEGTGEAHVTQWGIELGDAMAYGATPNTREAAELAASAVPGAKVREVRNCSWAGVTLYDTPAPVSSGEVGDCTRGCGCKIICRRAGVVTPSAEDGA